MVFSVIISCIIVLFTALITGWYYQYFKHSKYFLKYSGPPPIPIFGNTHKMMTNLDIIPRLMEWNKKYGSVLTVWLGYYPRFFISDYKTAEKLLASTTLIDKSYDYHFFEAWLGTGLLTSTSAKWKRQRKLLTPTFHFEILLQYINIFTSKSQILIDKLRRHAKDKPFDITPFINLCALDIISEAAMGIQIDAQEGKADQYADAIAELTDVLLRRSFSIYKSNDFFFKFTSDYRKQKNALKLLHGQTNYVIESRRKELEPIVKDEASEDAIGRKKRMAFLDLLLQCKVDGKPLSLDNVREEVDTFMFEGHDTTTMGICYTLYCLSLHPDIQDKAFEELASIFDDDVHRTPTYTDLQEMKYLDLVIKESMRLYPPVPFISRHIPKDTEFDGVLYKEGALFTVFFYGLHRQEETFPNPDKFDPDRFLISNTFDRSPFAYVPFSAGQRNCIGQRFAVLEMKTVISIILRNFKILPVAGYEPTLRPDAILRSVNGIQVRLVERSSTNY